MPYQIALAATEMYPYFGNGDLANFVDALSRTLSDRGHEVTVFLPYYEAFRESALRDLDDSHGRIRFRTHGSVLIPMGESSATAVLRIGEVEGRSVRIVLIGNDGFFHRPDPYGDRDTGEEWSDNAERFAFFSKAIIAAFKKLDWLPDVIHLNNAPTALVSVLLREGRETPVALRDVPCLLTIHSMEQQGVYDPAIVESLGVPTYLAEPLGPLEYYEKTGFLKAGMIYANRITTASPNYAEEILGVPGHRHGLEGVARTRQSFLQGILYGVDTRVWNPSTDELLPYRYDGNNLLAKRNNKIRLLESMELPVEPDVPVVAWIGDLTEKEGFGLLETIAGDLLGERVKLVVSGQGEVRYEQLLERLCKASPDKVAWLRESSAPMEHLMLAGSDFMLVTPRHAPCAGLEMRALRYGSVPIVYGAGGLIDTVAPFRFETGKGQGVVFDEYSGPALLAAGLTALELYEKKRAWKRLVQSNMQIDHSWEHAAELYEDAYRRTL